MDTQVTTDAVISIAAMLIGSFGFAWSAGEIGLLPAAIVGYDPLVRGAIVSAVVLSTAVVIGVGVGIYVTFRFNNTP